MNVESSTPRSVGRPRRGGAAAAPSTAVRRGGDRDRGIGRVGLVRGRATGSRSRCDGARGVVPRVAAARSRQYVADFEPAEDGEGRLTGVEAGLRYATGPAPLDAWRRAAEPMTACRYFRMKRARSIVAFSWLCVLSFPRPGVLPSAERSVCRSDVW